MGSVSKDGVRHDQAMRRYRTSFTSQCSVNLHTRLAQHSTQDYCYSWHVEELMAFLDPFHFKHSSCPLHLSLSQVPFGMRTVETQAKGVGSLLTVNGDEEELRQVEAARENSILHHGERYMPHELVLERGVTPSCQVRCRGRRVWRVGAPHPVFADRGLRRCFVAQNDRLWQQSFAATIQ